MELDLTFSDARWSAQVRTMIATLKAETIPFLTDELRFLLEKIVAFTPPKNRMQGTVRVRCDISKTIRPLNIQAFRSKRLEVIVRRQDHEAFRAYFKNVPNDFMKGSWSAPWSESLHSSRRISRGRVGSGNRSRQFVLGRSDTAKLKAYIKRKVANVGMAKAGWIPALRYVKGALPAWISRHGEELGGVVAELQGETPALMAINSTPWAARQDEGNRIVRNAMNSRVNAMRTRLRKMIQLARDKARLAS